jgi:hypothetical protein
MVDVPNKIANNSTYLLTGIMEAPFQCWLNNSGNPISYDQRIFSPQLLAAASRHSNFFGCRGEME